MDAIKTTIVPPLRWQELSDAIKDRKTMNLPGAGCASLESPNHWAGGSWDDAVRMMRDGWQQGAQAIDAVMAQMPDAVALTDAWQLEAAGRFPCVPAFLSGDPECMWQTVESDSTKPRVCVVVSSEYPNYVDAQDVTVYGAAVGALVRTLEAAGHGVAVYTIMKSQRGKGKQAQAFIVRDFGQPLDTSIVAFAFHPMFSRRITFAVAEVIKEWRDAGYGNGGYGCPQEADLADAVACLGEFPAVPVVLSGVVTCMRLGLTKPGREADLLAHMRREVLGALGYSA